MTCVRYTQHHCRLTTPPRGTPTNPHIGLPYISRTYIIIGLHFAADKMGLLRWNFYRGSVIFFFFQEWRFGRSTSSKVIDFCTNRKRVWDFLLVPRSNLGPIWHCFGDIADFTAKNSNPCDHGTWTLYGQMDDRQLTVASLRSSIAR